jgi:hypothetical protein
MRISGHTQGHRLAKWWAVDRTLLLDRGKKGRLFFLYSFRVVPETAPLGVARRSLGMTKFHSSCLDGYGFKDNKAY